MSTRNHFIFLFILTSIVVITSFCLIYNGFSYYQTHIDERFFHQDYKVLKPSGFIGHGLGIVGSLLMIIGILSYMIRKRSKRLMKVGLLKHWLEFHIFLCTLGPIMVLFHTSFKFGGIVSISFWSMVAVFLSGIVGRFIYIQIPRSIEGRELSLIEVKELKNNTQNEIINSQQLNEKSAEMILRILNPSVQKIHTNFIKGIFYKYIENKRNFSKAKQSLADFNLSKQDFKQILKLLKTEMSLNRKIKRLDTMKRLFNYWHVAHLPFALIMLIIMVVHVLVTIVFGYKWIF